MDMGVIGSGDQWFSSRVRTGGIYRLIDAALKEGSREARIEAIVHLGESRDPRAVYPLIECCGDSDPSIRRFAIEALGKIGSGRAVDVLVGPDQRRGRPGIDPERARVPGAPFEVCRSGAGPRNPVRDRESDGERAGAVAFMEHVPFVAAGEEAA
jgi:hypothetical protein